MKKVIFALKVLRSRFLTVRKEVSLIALIAMISILLIELDLKKRPAPFEVVYDLGQLYLKLCYSIFAAYLFYVINIHVPKEIRKVKTYRLINNHVLSIERLYELLLLTMFEPVDKTINKERLEKMNRFDFQKVCRKIDPRSKVGSTNMFANGVFNTHYELIHYVMAKINSNLNELFMFHDLLDADLLRRLTTIKDMVNKYYLFDFHTFGNSDMTALSHDFHELYEECQKMIAVFFKKYRHRYDFEYHPMARKNKGIKHPVRLRFLQVTLQALGKSCTVSKESD